MSKGTQNSSDTGNAANIIDTSESRTIRISQFDDLVEQNQAFGS
jgi:hypothetical protein